MSKIIQLKVGTTRIAIMIPFLGIVVKIPKISFIHVTKKFLKYGFSQKTRKQFYLYMLSPFGLRTLLAAGIVANWSEYLFYRKTKNPFVLPTYFSIFGFCNIQAIGEECDYTNTEIWLVLHEIAGNDLFGDNHCFMNSKNFCVSGGGKLRQLDYASKGSQKVILKYGQQFAALSGSP